MDRRDFMSTGASAAAALAIATGTASARGGTAIGDAGAGPRMSRAQFKAWLNTSFRIRPEGSLRSVPARLVAVNDGPSAAGLEQFSVVFQVEGAPASGLCELRHETGASLYLHLDGGRATAAGTHMLAVFSLIRAG
jgi:hypothetical protein